MPKINHDVELDYAGFNESHMRLTCHTCSETIVHQPYVKYEEWVKAVEKFLLVDHPCKLEIRCR